jgi:hypothetical protein
LRIFAYLDPGSGSIILQALIGGVAGAAVALKLFGRRILRTLRFWDRDEKELGHVKSETDG